MELLGLGVTPWLLASCLGLLTYWFKSRSEKFAFFRRRGIPGPAPSVIDGNYKELILSGTAPWLVVEKWIKAYGKVVGYFRTGPTPVLLISDHEMLKEILIKDFSHFSDRATLTSPRNRLPPIFRDSLTVLTGQDWKRVRSTITPTFTAKKMKVMSPAINEIVDVLLGILEGRAQTGETTDIYSLFQGLTLDVIGRCAFARNTDCQRNTQDIFLTNVRAIFANASSPVIRIIQMFPELNFIISRAIRRFAPNYKRGNIISEHLAELIKQRKEGKLNGHMDMIQLMLDANENPESVDRTDNGDAFSDVRKKYLTDGEMISNAFLFLLAGYETTANCLAFTTYLLAKHPDIKKGFVTRVASETVTINGQTIPARTGVEVPLWYLQHDPEVWNKPYEFDPERFSPENKPSIPPMAYLPFGAGPRNCVGMRFAQLEIKIALVRILQRYRLVKCAQSEPEIQLKHGIATINPKNGVFVRIEKRTSDN
ncbi:Cytochrome P450 3A24 [Hypsibius exemplaris]|uniref:Cytochrome P450 3A24 n=1 Tax=Hypsibius exemplaris TaxID=2072580 RepID=A0A9X6RMJ6_HYPEX|nr:Cytochrome P450 3A24 [Hypsibius exemplaris]